MTVVDERVSDGELLRRFAAGRDAAGEEAFAELVRRHLGWVYGAARRMTGDAGLAEDVAQGVFLAMSQKAGKLAGHPCLAAWLFEATRMGSSTLLRGRRREKERERVVAERKAVSEEAGGADVELLERVDAAVGRLCEGERRVVLLHFYSGMSLGDVGAAVGLSEAAVRKRLWRAMEKLRGWLGVKEDTAGFGGVVAGVVGMRAPSGLSARVIVGKGSVGASAVSAAVQGAGSWGWVWGSVSLAAVVGVAAVTAVVMAGRGGAGTPVTGATTPVSAPTAASTQAIVASVQTLEQEISSSVVGGTAADEGKRDGYWDRERGAVMREVYAHGVYVTRDDGKHPIRYREGRGVASPNFGDLVPDNFSKYVGGNLFEKVRGAEQRVSQRDIVGPGGKLFCYEVDDPKLEGMTYWRDERGANIEWGFESPPLNRGEPREVEHSRYTINPALPAGFWERPAGLQVVDPRVELGKAYPLEKAIFQKEAHGTIAAVHSLRQDEDGDFYIVMSTRMTDATWKAIGDVKFENGRRPMRMTGARLTAWDAQARRLTREYNDWTIARLETEGIQVCYVVIVPKDVAAVGNRCHLTFMMNPIETRDQLFQKAPTQEGFVEFDLRAEGAKETLDGFAGDTFDAADSMDGIGDEWLESSSVKRKRRDSRFRPAEMTKAEFVAGVEKGVARVVGMP